MNYVIKTGIKDLFKPQPKKVISNAELLKAYAEKFHPEQQLNKKVYVNNNIYIKVKPNTILSFIPLYHNDSVRATIRITTTAMDAKDFTGLVSAQFPLFILKSILNKSYIYPYISIYHNDSVDTTKLSPTYSTPLDENKTNISAQFPLFLNNPDLIKIPSKVENAVKKYLSKNFLSNIHADETTAVELCLLLLSNLSSTYLTTDQYKKKGWKNLKATFLDDLLGNQDFTLRKKIIEALKTGTNKGSIIECDNSYSKGLYSMSYRLGESYLGKGIVTYALKTDVVKTLVKKNYYSRLSELNSNPIAKNLINLYSRITLPSVEQIKEKAKQLIKQNYHTKKGKRLTFLNKHSKSYFKNASELSFVEESIEIFDYLTTNGFLIPTISEKAGGRITDSLNLMPSWIRNMVLIDGAPIEEIDYSALHPNIAVNLYSGKTGYISHSTIAEEFALPISTVKIEHLSFFNKELKDMAKSPLYNYYLTKEPEMMENIIRDKGNNGYKITTKKLFSKEVSVMTDVIRQLNFQNITVGYIYDALFCIKSDKVLLTQIMNDTILRHGIKTTAK